MEIDLRLMQASDCDEILKMVITTWDYRSWVPKDPRFGRWQNIFE